MRPSRDRLAAALAALADRYRIARELGQGGMVTVYLAQDLEHDRKVDDARDGSGRRGAVDCR